MAKTNPTENPTSIELTPEQSGWLRAIATEAAARTAGVLRALATEGQDYAAERDRTAGVLAKLQAPEGPVALAPLEARWLHFVTSSENARLGRELQDVASDVRLLGQCQAHATAVLAALGGRDG